MSILSLIKPIHALSSNFLTTHFNNIPHISEGLTSCLFHSGFPHNTRCAIHFSLYLLHGSVFAYLLNRFTTVIESLETSNITLVNFDAVDVDRDIHQWQDLSNPV